MGEIPADGSVEASGAHTSQLRLSDIVVYYLTLYVIYTVARAREGVGRTWGITATSRAPGAAHLGHHRTQGRPQVRLSHTESGYTVPQAGRVGRL